MSSFFSNFFNLIQKTGGRWIVTDQAGKPSLVVMGWQDWEKLISHQNFSSTSLPKGNEASFPPLLRGLGLTGEELLDRINREISLWRASQEESNLQKPEKEVLVEEEKYYLESVE